MSRHKWRLDRLTRGMGASAEDFEGARLGRMTDEELLAEAVIEAVKAGLARRSHGLTLTPLSRGWMLKAIGSQQ